MNSFPTVLCRVDVPELFPLFFVPSFESPHEVGNVLFRLFVGWFRLVGQGDIQVIPGKVTEYGPIEFLFRSLQIPFLCLFCGWLVIRNSFFSPSQTIGMVFLSLYDSFSLEYFFTVCHRYHLTT